MQYVFSNVELVHKMRSFWRHRSVTCSTLRDVNTVRCKEVSVKSNETPTWCNTVLHQVGVSFDLYYDARKHKIKIEVSVSLHKTYVSTIYLF